MLRFDSFEYTALAEPTSIRLVSLLPEDDNEMIQITMDEYDLDEHIPRSVLTGLRHPKR